MRIISQDGLLDVPYEKVMIEICGGEIFAVSSELFSNRSEIPEVTLAYYSTNEKAVKVMEMCWLKHREYVKKTFNYSMGLIIPDKVFRFPLESEVQ